MPLRVALLVALTLLLSGCFRSERPMFAPESAVRAGMLGLPMALAIIGGRPERFVPLVDMYRRTARAAGHVPAPAVSINATEFDAIETTASVFPSGEYPRPCTSS